MPSGTRLMLSRSLTDVSEYLFYDRYRPNTEFTDVIQTSVTLEVNIDWVTMHGNAKYTNITCNMQYSS